MARYENDGTVSRGKGEHYHVEGCVILRVYVSFDTHHEIGTYGYDDNMNDAIGDGIASKDWNILDDDDVYITIERDDE